MKVYYCEFADHAGGLFVVAANSKKEAFSIASEYDGIVPYCLPLEEWEQVKELSANVDKPQVLLASYYIE